MSFPANGNRPTSDGRSIPRTRPKCMIAPAIIAPVFPAETKASASRCLSMRNPTTIDDRFFWRAACAGCSSISITSGASTKVIESGRAASRASSRSTASVWPTSATRTPSCRAAVTAPSTIAPGALSPPIASRAIKGSSAIVWNLPTSDF